jgi:hypothetical protein
LGSRSRFRSGSSSSIRSAPCCRKASLRIALEYRDYLIRWSCKHGQSARSIDILDCEAARAEQGRRRSVRKPYVPTAVPGGKFDISVSHYNRYFFCPRPPLPQALAGVTCHLGLLHWRSPVSRSPMASPSGGNITDQIGNRSGNIS